MSDEGTARDLAYEFELDLELLCDEWDKAGIKTDNIRRGINEFDGAVATAQSYVRLGTEGFNLACKALGCEKTIEALVARPEYTELFDGETIKTAQDRLAAAGN